MLKIIFILVLISRILFGIKTKIECGYKQCPPTREGALNVHIVPHSHMDAGWVKTFDEYYYGTRASVSTANVQLIFHSVLSELLHDKRRKFTFSETAYFWRWWKEQRPQTRASFRTLVQEGRIQFAGAGWTHADSATVGYLHALDQATWGLRKLNDTLGPCGKPKAAWQIDTYGHTREMTSLLAQMGFDGIFIGRVDQNERDAMMEEDRMEFIWRGSDVLGKMTDIMTHTMFVNLYNAPEGFCFDFLCNDEPIVDDPESKVYNADKRVNDFITQIERQAKYYNHDSILVTMGGDFTYQSAAHWFMNIDKLINHVNTHPANMSDINIFYSTPACYLKAIYLYGRRDKAVYTEKDDLVPYGSSSSMYWTGFYTSRPSLKYFIRKSHMFLQVVKQLTVIAQSSDSYELHLLRHAVGLVAHHDAITGTSQQHVANDFVKTLYDAVEGCSKKLSNLISNLTPTWGTRRTKNTQQFQVCHQLNISQCKFFETQNSILLLVYNPSSVKTYHYVKLPAIALHYSIRDYNDEEVEYQLVPLPAAVINLPGRSSNAIQELYFEAENIPPLGFLSYYITPIRDQLEENNYVKKQKIEPDADNELTPFISNEYLKVTVNQTTGLLDTISHMDSISVKISQNFYFYSQGHQPLQSGAYSFSPEKPRPTPVAEKVQYNTIRGTLVKEIRQRFNDWITQIIRLYRGEEFVEFEWIVGPVPIGTDLGKEVVSIYSSNITSAGEFFTDSNGRQMMKRTCRNETNNHKQKKPAPACYYPVTSRICVRCMNCSTEMCVLTDRAQGGTSYNDGEIELMIHRRLLTDDGFGLEESLNEEEYGLGLIVKGKHRIVFGNHREETDGMTSSERISSAARRWEYEPWLFFTTGDKVNKRKWQNYRNKRFSGLRVHGLPRHIHILTLEPWKTGSVLLRLENTLEKTSRGNTRRESEAVEDTSSYITVKLKNIFLQLRLNHARETTLGANQWLDDARQMDWSTRYVYNGGDDGILPEDAIEEDEQTNKHAEKETDHYSDEESEYLQKKPQKLSKKMRSKSTGYIRRKRSPIETDDDGIIIDLLNDSKFKINKVVEITNQDERTKRSTNESSAENNDTENMINKTLESSDGAHHLFDKKVKDISTTTETINKSTKYRKLAKKRIRTNDRKCSQRTEVLRQHDDVKSSEEDFSSTSKRRYSRKKNRRHRKNKNEKKVAELVYHDSDDGVTKSIYEMYYKTLRNPFNQNRKTEQHQEVNKLKKSQIKAPLLNKSKDLEETGNLKIQHEPVETPKVRRRDVYPKHDEEPGEDDDEDDYDNDEESIEQVKRRPRNRKKRTTLNEDGDDGHSTADENDADSDYVITLRPTQIRTFIIWFNKSRKTYRV